MLEQAALTVTALAEAASRSGPTPLAPGCVCAEDKGAASGERGGDVRKGEGELCIWRVCEVVLVLWSHGDESEWLEARGGDTPPKGVDGEGRGVVGRHGDVTVWRMAAPMAHFHLAARPRQETAAGRTPTDTSRWVGLAR